MLLDKLSHSEIHVIKALVKGGGSTSETIAYKFLRADFSLFTDRDSIRAMWDYCDPNFKQAIVDTANVTWSGDDVITTDNFIERLRISIIKNLKHSLTLEIDRQDSSRYLNDDDDELYMRDLDESEKKAALMIEPLFA